MEEMKKFEINGSFKMGDKMQKFSKTVEAVNAKHAKEIAYSLMGSKHNTPRRMIKIDSVKDAEA